MKFPRPIPRFLLDGDEAAASLGLSRDTFDRLVAAGKIRAPLYPAEEIPRPDGRPRVGNRRDPRWRPEWLTAFADALEARDAKVEATLDAIAQGLPARPGVRPGRRASSAAASTGTGAA